MLDNPVIVTVIGAFLTFLGTVIGIFVKGYLARTRMHSSEVTEILKTNKAFRDEMRTELLQTKKELRDANERIEILKEVVESQRFTIKTLESN